MVTPNSTRQPKIKDASHQHPRHLAPTKHNCIVTTMTVSAPKKASDQPVVATSAHHVHGTAEARLLGSAVAGVSELALFHPVDTVAKRLMTTEAQVIVFNNMTTTASNLNSAIFKDAAALNNMRKIASLFPGVGFGAAYKILQRVYKFGGQVC